MSDLACPWCEECGGIGLVRVMVYADESGPPYDDCDCVVIARAAANSGFDLSGESSPLFFFAWSEKGVD